jgi:hypothetical protein
MKYTKDMNEIIAIEKGIMKLEEIDLKIAEKIYKEYFGDEVSE